MTTELETQAPDMPTDVFPELTLTSAEIEQRIKSLKEFVRDHMTEGEDYGLIPGCGPKPVLLKPGAEKLNLAFGLAPTIEITDKLEDWDKGFVSYAVKVTLLNKRTNGIEADGIGSCNSREKRYQKLNAADVANTVLKMAKKRALVDATLSATRASGLFTQDLEDNDTNDRPPQRSYQQTEHRSYNGNGNGRAHPPAQQQGRPAPQSQQNGRAAGNGGSGASDAQRGAITALGRAIWGDEAAARLPEAAGKPIANLSKAEASALIERLQRMKDSPPAEQQPTAPMITRDQHTRIMNLATAIFGSRSALADAENIAGLTLAELTQADADELIGKLGRLQEQRRPAAPTGTRPAAQPQPAAPAAAQPPAPGNETPVERIRRAMREQGTPFVRANMPGWMTAINAYRRDQYDAAALDTISQIPEGETDDIVQAIEEQIIAFVSESDVREGIAA